MKKLLGEIHGRSLWQVLGLYLAGSWIALQVVETLTESASLPDWVPALALVMLVIGFPIVMATAFVQHGGPGSAPGADGAELAHEAPGAQPTAADAAAVPATQAAPESAPIQVVTAEPAAHHRLFTWRNAISGGVLAFALVGLLAAGWLITRSMGIGPAATLVAKGVLEDRAPVLVADFESAADQGDLGHTATVALRTDLSQSQVITIVEPTQVADVLQRMEQDADARLDLDLAREVAIREGYPAVITGEITTAGSAFVVSARMVDATSGEVLLSDRVRADDESAILDAIDQLSENLRERVGESLSTLRAEPALAVVTTTNLEALRKYTEAVRAIETEGNQERGIALLEEAVTLDPDFAMAWRKLGTELNNRNEDRSRTVEALTRAYELRDRLTRREQYLTAATYYTMVTNESDKAVTAYENLLDIEPDNDRALNNLGNAYSALRDLPRAEEYFSRAAVVDSSNSIPFTNAVGIQVNLGMYEEATAMLERSGRLFPDDPYVRQYRALFLGHTQDPRLATDSITALRDDWIGSLFWRGQLNGVLAAQAATRGLLSEYEAATRDAIQSLDLRELPGEVLESTVSGAWIDLDVRRDPERAIARIEAALESHPLADIAPLDRPYLGLATLYAAAGRTDEAKALLAEYETAIPEHARRGMEPDELRARGMVAVSEGRHEEGLALIHRSDFGACQFCMRSFLAYAAREAGTSDEAIAAMEEFVTFPDLFRYSADQAVLGSSLERLGQLYDERGDSEKAAEYHAQFVELWAEADDELQPRVRAAQARLEEIVRERG